MVLSWTLIKCLGTTWAQGPQWTQPDILASCRKGPMSGTKSLEQIAGLKINFKIQLFIMKMEDFFIGFLMINFGTIFG